MAITAVLVYAGHNRLRYLISSSATGESVSIESDGGVTPDLQTDSLQGPIKQISLVKAQGYGLIATGGITTQAQARALWQSDNNLTLVGPNRPTGICRIDTITGTPNGWIVDAVRGPSDLATPGLTITNTTAGAASCYLDLSIPGSIGA